MPRLAVLASCVAAALLAARNATAASGPSLRAEPQRLVLGSDARAAIVIEGTGDVPPTVSVSVGRVERLRPAGEGRFVAEYVPPAERYPQVAIVAALVGEAWGWTAIPLAGRGVAIAHSAPYARIRVTIGDASFGPVTADRSGEARVPVVAAPGVRFAYHRDKPLDLNVPPALHVHLALGRSEANADVAQGVPLRAFVVAPTGAARAGAPLRIEVSEGLVVDLAEVTPGSWAGTWRLAPGRAGVARASAALADEPGVAAAVQLARGPGVLARLSVQTAEARVAANGVVSLRVVATDAAGNPVDAAPEVEATLGELSELVPVTPGTWEARLAVPAKIDSTRRLQLVARASGVEGQRELEISAGPPVALEVSADSAALVADGGASARLRVLLRDRWGNPADAPAPDIVSTRRAEIAAEPDGPGTWLVHYRPARVRKDGTDVLTVRAGTLEGAARFAIVAPERRLGLAPKVGLAAGGALAPYAAVEARYRTPLFGGRLGLTGEVGGFVRSRTDTTEAGDVAVEVHGRVRYLPALVTGRWETRFGARQALWIGGGAGVAHVASEVSTSGGRLAAEAGLAPLLHAGAGWALRHGNGGPFVEARLARFGDPGFDALRGSLAVLLAAVGYGYDAY